MVQMTTDAHWVVYNDKAGYIVPLLFHTKFHHQAPALLQVSSNSLLSD